MPPSKYEGNNISGDSFIENNSAKLHEQEPSKRLIVELAAGFTAVVEKARVELNAGVTALVEKRRA